MEREQFRKNPIVLAKRAIAMALSGQTREAQVHQRIDITHVEAPAQTEDDLLQGRLPLWEDEDEDRR